MFECKPNFPFFCLFSPTFALSMYCKVALAGPAEGQPLRISFLAEMEPLPEVSDESFAYDACELPDGWDENWREVFTLISSAINTAKVQALWKWAKLQMQTYSYQPSLAFPQPYLCNADHSIAELIVQDLPSHSPLVTRALKIYLN